GFAPAGSGLAAWSTGAFGASSPARGVASPRRLATSAVGSAVAAWGWAAPWAWGGPWAAAAGAFAAGAGLARACGSRVWGGGGALVWRLCLRVAVRGRAVAVLGAGLAARLRGRRIVRGRAREDVVEARRVGARGGRTLGRLRRVGAALGGPRPGDALDPGH